MSEHPLAELADGLATAATMIEDEWTGTDGWIGDDSRDAYNASLLAQRIALSLHPDVARCALALAEGLRVPDGWTVAMGGVSAWYGIVIGRPDGAWRRVTPVESDGWRVGDGWHATAQAAVDAAVKALGGAS